MSARIPAATGALFIALLVPASAQAVVTIDPLKPCYVSAETPAGPQTEGILIRATGFTPNSTVDLSLDGQPVENGQGLQADNTGTLALPLARAGSVRRERDARVPSHVDRDQQPGQHGHRDGDDGRARCEREAAQGQALEDHPVQGRRLHGPHGGLRALRLQGQAPQDRADGAQDERLRRLDGPPARRSPSSGRRPASGPSSSTSPSATATRPTRTQASTASRSGSASRSRSSGARVSSKRSSPSAASTRM